MDGDEMVTGNKLRRELANFVLAETDSIVSKKCACGNSCTGNVFRVEVPIAVVSGNNAFRFTKGGGRYVSHEVADFKRRVGDCVFPAILKAQWKAVKWCEVRIDVYNTRADLDNLAKTTLDSLNRRVIQDDRYIRKLVLEKHKDSLGARFIVEVSETEAL